jgi:diacylglycerol kinase family enzyme
MAYVEHIVRSSFSYRFPTISVQIVDPGAEEVVRGTTVFFFNLPRYALGLPFAPTAREDDGWLDLVVFRHPGPLRALYYLWKVLCGIHFQDPSVFHRRIRKAVVTAQEAIPVQLDGDPGGYLLPRHAATADAADGGHPVGHGPRTDGRGTAAWTVDVLPSALSMIVPSRHADRIARAPLASNGPA